MIEESDKKSNKNLNSESNKESNKELAKKMHEVLKKHSDDSDKKTDEMFKNFTKPNKKSNK